MKFKLAVNVRTVTDLCSHPNIKVISCLLFYMFEIINLI